jgi:hypothetical protein
MHNDGQVLVRKYVDTALAFLAAHGLMMAPAIIVDAAKLDPSRSSFDKMGKQVGWKPIPSSVTASDIQELEQAIGATLPALYVDFLQYLHFFDLDDAAEISFLMHDVKECKNTLLNHYFFLHEPGTLTQQGYIWFAYDQDLRAICFAVNQRTPDRQDCAVVRIHDIYQNPAPVQLLYDSFFDLLLNLRAAQSQRDALDS